MKKTVALLLSFGLMISLAACGSGVGASGTGESSSTEYTSHNVADASSDPAQDAENEEESTAEPSATSDSAQDAVNEEESTTEEGTTAPSADPVPETAGEGEAATDAQTSAASSNADVPVVYMTTDISPEGLMNVYKALGDRTSI